MQKENVEKSLKYFCFKYIYFNLFIISFTLYQFREFPIALPLTLSIMNELITMFLFSNGRRLKLVDHFLHISLYIYLIVVYYLEKKYYVFCNVSVVLSFLINIDCRRKSEIQQEFTSTIRLTKLFYRFTLLVSVLCVSLKLSDLVSWSWAQTFWWYWMLESGLVGATLTILMILVSKLLGNNYQFDNQKQEVKTFLWALYIALYSSVIAGLWIINTLNKLNVKINLEIGDVIFYIVCGFNIIAFPVTTYCVYPDIVEYTMTLNSVEAGDSSPNTPNTTTQEKTPQLKKIPTKTQIFLKKLSNAYFKQIKDPEILVLKYQNNQNEIETERNVTKKIIIKQSEPQQSQNKCLVCFENQSNAVLMSCGHGGLCYQCAMQLAQKTKECFLCRQTIKEIYEIAEKDYSILKRVISKTRISM